MVVMEQSIISTVGLNAIKLISLTSSFNKHTGTYKHPTY